MHHSNPRTRPLALALAGVVGFVSILGLITVNYAQGTAYFSNDPAACIQCHIMRDQFDSWVKGSHHGFATCNSCHLPEHPVMKWVSKADNGFFHSWAFTFRNHPDPIRIKPRNRDIVEANCQMCHAVFTHDLVVDAPAGDGISCLHCHKDAGHAAFR